MTLLLNNDDVKQLLTMEMTIDALDRSYRELTTGQTVCRPRIDIEIPTSDPTHLYRWGTMEGGSSTRGYFAIRMKSDIIYESEYQGVVTEEKFCVRPGLFCGLVLLFSVENAEPLALINEGYLQHFRVGADAAIGARYMAREDVRVLGMIGSGGMARSHVEALRQVRSIERVQVFSPTPEHREAYVQEVKRRFEIEAVAVDKPEDAFRGADIVCECTDSQRPVVIGEWLEPGTHITNIGGRLDAETYGRIDVSLRLGAAPHPLGVPEWQTERSVLTYRAEPPPGAPPSRIKQQEAGRERLKGKTVMMEDLLSGRAKGRTSPEQITHSTRGNTQGAQFFAVAGAVYETAKAKGLGRDLPTEWFLQDIRD